MPVILKSCIYSLVAGKLNISWIFYTRNIFNIIYLLWFYSYVEAVDVNHNLASVVPKFEVVGRETAKQNSKVGRVTTRDLLVGAFSKTLPGVTNELISFCRKEKDKIYRYKEGGSSE